MAPFNVRRISRFDAEKKAGSKITMRIGKFCAFFVLVSNLMRRL
jgi:hypothetical protein